MTAAVCALLKVFAEGVRGKTLSSERASPAKSVPQPLPFLDLLAYCGYTFLTYVHHALLEASLMLRNAALSILLLSIVLLIGCGRTREAQQVVQAGRQLQQTGETTIKTDEGEVQIKTDKAGEQATITVESESGEKHSVTVVEDLDTSALSLAIYPGATQQGGQTTETAAGKYLNFVFTTTDSFDEVADFYKNKYPDSNVTEITRPDARMFSIAIAKPPNMASIAVQQADAEDQVTIILMEQK